MQKKKKDFTIETNKVMLRKKLKETWIYSSAHQYYTVHSVTLHLVLSLLLIKLTLLERLQLNNV